MMRICTLPYCKVERKVTGTEQLHTPDYREMILYADRIATRHREFPLEDVFDISHRQMGGGEGLLYLHTSTGVYSYMVEDDPKPFIGAFRNLYNDSRDGYNNFN